LILAPLSVKEVHAIVVELKETIARLIVRADHSDQAIDRLNIESIRDRLARLETRLKHLEKRHSEGRDRSWDLWKLVFAAFLGAILALAVSFVGWSLNRLIGTGSNQVGPSIPTSRLK